MTITEILDRNARLTPQNVALVEVTPSKGLRREITWKEFDDKANQFANALMARGVKKGDVVVHLMMNSIEWLIRHPQDRRDGGAAELPLHRAADQVLHRHR